MPLLYIISIDDILGLNEAYNALGIEDLSNARNYAVFTEQVSSAVKICQMSAIEFNEFVSDCQKEVYGRAYG